MPIKSPVGRNLTDAMDGILKGKRYLIHDREPLFTDEFLKALGDSGVKSVILPARCATQHHCIHSQRQFVNVRLRLPSVDLNTDTTVAGISTGLTRRPFTLFQ